MGEQFTYGDGARPAFLLRGVSGSRPEASAVRAGTVFYDETLSMLLVSDGSSWGYVGDSRFFAPETVGFKAVTIPVELCITTYQPTSGRVVFQRIRTRPGAVISNVHVPIATKGATLTSNRNFVGAYTLSGGSRLGLTADQATAWSSGGNNVWVTAAFTSPFVSPGEFWLALLCVGSTTITTLRGNNTMTPNGIASSKTDFVALNTTSTSNTALASTYDIAGDADIVALTSRVALAVS